MPIYSNTYIRKILHNNPQNRLGQKNRFGKIKTDPRKFKKNIFVYYKQCNGNMKKIEINSAAQKFCFVEPYVDIRL